MTIRHILVVEDDEDIRELSVEQLQQEGFTVKSARNGKEALLSLSTLVEPCLILLDMLMPVMNGKEFMLEFAKLKHTIAPIPVYLVSASAESADSKDLGCLGFLRKPFEPEALLAIVREHCGK